MICERCKKNEASVHLTEIIKSVKSEIHLCEVCAREIGLNSKLSSFSLSIPDILSFLDSETIQEGEEVKICPSCSFTFADISRKNKLGCQNCYSVFSDALEQMIRNIKPNFSGYTGRVPENYERCDNYENIVLQDDIETEDIVSLKKLLSTSLMEENYEKAALIRDRMNMILSQAAR